MSFASALADRFDVQNQRDRWKADPVAWVQERLGETVWSKQAEVMRSVAENKLTSVQSSHGVGKSHLASRLVGWYLDVHDPGEVFVVTTAPTWAQVRAILWRYIAQMHARGNLSGYVTQNAEWKIGSELVAFGRKPADTDNQGMQGIHAPVGVLAVIDESSGVPAQIWNAIDSLVTTPASRVCAVGNPDSLGSQFHKVCTTEPGWNRIKISSFDTPAWTGEDVPQKVLDGLVSPEWVEDKRVRWGENSPLYQVKVRGEFSDSEDGLIPLSWVIAANNRWREWNDNYDGIHEPKGRKVFGVDVARYGDDKTAIATRQGDVVLGIESFSKLDTTQTTGLVQARLRSTVQGLAVVDVVGVGAGVVDQLRRAGCAVKAFNGSTATKRRDSSGSWKMANTRVASWYNLRELLDPALGASLCLPPDDDLTADLTAPTYEPRAGGVLWVEDKDSVKKRLGHSPDLGDAVAMACWVDAFPRADDADKPPLRPVAYSNRGGSWA